MMKKTSQKGTLSALPIVCTSENYFGQALKEIRLEKGFTQAQAAKLLNTTQAHWSAFELGKNKPNLDTILAISKVLKINPFDLFNRSLKKTSLFNDFSFEPVPTIEPKSKRNIRVKKSSNKSHV